jgi:hypothetical protein
MSDTFADTAPLSSALVTEGVAFAKALPPISPPLSVDHFYLHWTAGGYCGVDGAYNFTVQLAPDGESWQMVVGTDPRDNARTIVAGEPYAAHTYLRNSHALGFVVDCMAGATPNDFGDVPLQMHQLEALCAMVGAVAAVPGYNVAIGNRNLCMTHAEAAILDGYFITDSPPDGDTRWDLARFAEDPSALEKPEAIANANRIRSRALKYGVAISQVLRAKP